MSSTAEGRPRPLTRPTGLAEIIGNCFRLYARHPLLFAVIAFGVVAPFEILVFALGGGAPDASGGGSTVGDLVASLGAWLIETPLITALHVVAVRKIDAGGRPALRSTVTVGLAALPAVSLVVVLGTLGEVVGFLFLIIPGVVLWVRWIVAAPVVVVEGTGGWGALQRSHALTTGAFWRAFALIALSIAISLVTLPVIPDAPRHATLGSANFLVSVTRTTLIQSFTALTTTLLYFSLRHGGSGPDG